MKRSTGTKVELTNPFSATYDGRPLTRAQWSTGGPLRVQRGSITARFLIRPAEYVISAL